MRIASLILVLVSALIMPQVSESAPRPASASRGKSPAGFKQAAVKVFRWPASRLRARKLSKMFGDARHSPLLRANFPDAFAKGTFNPKVLKQKILVRLNRSEQSRKALGEMLEGGTIGHLGKSIVAHKALRKNRIFRQAVRQYAGKEGLRIVDSREVAKAFQKMDREKLGKLYAKGTTNEHTDSEVLETDAKIRDYVAERANGATADVLSYLGFVEHYARTLYEAGIVDTDLGILSPSANKLDFLEQRSLPDSMVGKGVYVWGKFRHVLNFQRSFHIGFTFELDRNNYPNHILLQKTHPRVSQAIIRKELKKIGLQVRKFSHVNKEFAFVESLPKFGDEVIEEFMRTGEYTAEIKGLLDAYKKLSKSPFAFRNIHPRGFGQRADGTWVLADWSFDGPLFLEADIDGPLHPGAIQNGWLSGIDSAYQKAADKFEEDVLRKRALEIAYHGLETLEIKPSAPTIVEWVIQVSNRSIE